MYTAARAPSVSRRGWWNRAAADGHVLYGCWQSRAWSEIILCLRRRRSCSVWWMRLLNGGQSPWWQIVLWNGKRVRGWAHSRKWEHASSLCGNRKTLMGLQKFGNRSERQSGVWRLDLCQLAGFKSAGLDMCQHLRIQDCRAIPTWC